MHILLDESEGELVRVMALNETGKGGKLAL